MLVIVCVEGVLTDPTEPVLLAKPLQPGIALLNGLVRGAHQVVLLTEAEYNDELKVDLRTKGIAGHVTVMSAPQWVNYEAWRVGRVQALRAVGWSPELFIDPSPSVCAKVLKQGVTTVVYTVATFARGDWRPDFERKVRPWDEVVESIEEEQRLRSAFVPVNEVAGTVTRGL